MNAGSTRVRRLFGAIVAGTLLGSAPAASAQVKVMISGGFSGPYEKLLPEFERTTGVKVLTLSGSSQGNGPETIAAQLARGVPVDVVILSREGLTDLIAAHRIAPGSDTDLARTPLGVAVRTGAPKPDVRTVDAFKQLVVRSKAVAIPSSTSGIFLTDTVFPRLGIAKTVNVVATPRGTGAAALVASGAAAIAVMPVSEIVHAPGVELAGVIADEIQLNQVFAAAIVASSTERDTSRRLIAFLSSERASGTIKDSGMEPLTAARRDR
jgi:molybdate transport system substrate-binding protein